MSTQKNMLLHDRTVNVYLPAIRVAYGSFAAAVDVMAERLYNELVAEVGGIQEDLDTVAAVVAALEEVHGWMTTDVEWRYAPRQRIGDVPKWTHLAFTSGSRFVDQAVQTLKEHDVPVLIEPEDGETYVIVKTAALLDLSFQVL